MTTHAPAAPTLDVTIHYHVAILEPRDDEVNTFWFANAEDLADGLRRKLGIVDSTGLVEHAARIPGGIVHAARDPRHGYRLILAPDAESLETLAQRLQEAHDAA